MAISVIWGLACVCLLSYTESADDSKPWDYDFTPGSKTGPAYWGQLPGFESCNGKSQTPINIDTMSARHDPQLREFKFHNYGVIRNLRLYITNDGYSAKVVPEGVYMYLTGGGLVDTYKFWQLHFHWGHQVNKGSEHYMDNVQYPLELHMVHYKSKFDSPTEALQSGESDALAVLGFFFEISNAPNPGYYRFLDDLEQLIDGAKNGTVIVDTFDIDHLYEDGIGPYFRYMGSLTTPPCNEAVVWTVYKNTIKISQEQLEVFWKLKDATGQVAKDNYRPLQELGDHREVTKFIGVMPTDGTAGRMTGISAVLVVCSLMAWFL